MDAAISPGLIVLSEGGFNAHHLMVPAGLALITLALLMRYRKRRQRFVRAARPTPHEQLERSHQFRGLRGDLEQLMVEVEQLAKRFATQLDAKSIELQKLMREADQRIDELRRLSERDLNAPTNASAFELRPDEPPPADPADAGIEDRNAIARRIYAMADAGMQPEQIAQELSEQIGEVELILALREAS